MTDAVSQWDLFKNAVAGRYAGLTAIEIPSEEKIDFYAGQIKALIAPRAFISIRLNTSISPAVTLVDSINHSLADSVGSVVGIEDRSPLHSANAARFWRDMNLMRERLAAVKAHIIFMLKPFNYSLLLTEADHLADYMELRLHLDDGATMISEDEKQNRDEIPSWLPFYAENPKARLAELETALFEATKRKKAGKNFSQWYYFPMTGYALAAGDILKAQSYTEKISPDHLRRIDIPGWYYLNAVIAYRQNDKKKASAAIQKALSTADPKMHAEVVLAARQIEKVLGFAPNERDG